MNEYEVYESHSHSEVLVFFYFCQVRLTSWLLPVTCIKLSCENKKLTAWLRIFRDCTTYTNWNIQINTNSLTQNLHYSWYLKIVRNCTSLMARVILVPFSNSYKIKLSQFLLFDNMKLKHYGYCYMCSLCI